MKKSEAFPTRFLSAPDLKGKAIVVTIKSTTRETLKSDGKETEKTILHFVGAKKGLVVNQVDWDSIAEITGDDDDAGWPGHKIELYPKRVPMGGTTVDGIRIRQPAGELPLKKTAPEAQKSSVAEEMDDEIPF